MIGNNSCGSTAQAYGKVVDNFHRLEVLTYDGVRTWVGRTGDGELERLIAAEGRQPELYRGAWRRCGTSTPSGCASATSTSPDGCPATTWTRCCQARVGGHLPGGRPCAGLVMAAAIRTACLRV